MIRSALSLLAIISVTCPTSAPAQDIVTDAFGLYLDDSDPERQTWAGLVTPLERPDDGETILPTAAETLLLHFGDKSIVAGTGAAQISALVLDQAGNLVSDDTEVALTAEDGTSLVSTTGGIAARAVAAGAVPGRFYAWAATGNADALRQTERVTYRVAPALSSLSTDLSPSPTPLSPETVVHLRGRVTAALDEQTIPDGITSTLLLSHTDGSFSQVPALWIGGQPNAPLLTRDLSGTATAQMHFPFHSSRAIGLTIADSLPGSALSARITILTDIEATRIVLGPFTTASGHNLHDGSSVVVRLIDANNQTHEAQSWVLDGMTEITLPTTALPATLSVTSPRGVEIVTLAPTGDSN